MSKTKKYKIIPIKHLLRNNEIAISGQVVLGSAFVNLQDALDRGICEEVEGAAEELSDEVESSEGVDLTKMNEMEIVGFAKENGYKLTKKVIKEGKEAMISEIIKQAE